MKEERLMILNMVNEGKISTEDATKLLEALKHPNKQEYYYDTEEKLSKFSQSVDAFAKDFGEKIEGLFKEAEPKFKKATKAVVEKTANVINDISNSLNESLKKMDDSECNCGCNCDDNRECDCSEAKPEEDDQPKPEVDDQPKSN